MNRPMLKFPVSATPLFVRNTINLHFESLHMLSRCRRHDFTAAHGSAGIRGGFGDLLWKSRQCQPSVLLMKKTHGGEFD